MTLIAVWFFLWALLWAVYFVTDGFDLGVGMLLPFLGKDETRKRMLYNATGPLWDGNEVWLISAGGVTFAAFPKTYAVMFSSFYTALTLLLVALIIRGVSMEFRSKADTPGWKKTCDVCQFFGSFLITLLIGVAFANIFQGLPLKDGIFQGGFFTLLNPYGIAGGILFICVFLLHGALWLVIKTEGDLHRDALAAAHKLWWVVLIVTVAFLIYSYVATNLYVNYLAHVQLWLIPLGAVIALIKCKWFLAKGKHWSAWFASAFFILATTFFTVVGLFPNMLPSTIDPAANSITCYNAASSNLTLKIMLVVVIIFVPLVLIYQIWAYNLFKHKVVEEELIY